MTLSVDEKEEILSIKAPTPREIKFTGFVDFYSPNDVYGELRALRFDLREFAGKEVEVLVKEKI